MRERYFVGVDGGATKTRAVVCNATLSVLGTGLAGPSNHHVLGLDKSREHIQSAIQEALRAAGIAREQVAATGLGMAGVDSPEDRALLEGALRALGLPCVTLTNDGMSALLGATEGQPGVVVVAGTGAIAFGLDARGQSCRAGGWGYILGDEGSAYDIGRRGMVAALWAYDGRGAATTLLERMMAHYRFTDIRGAIHLVYDQKLPHSEIAAFARVVSQAAMDGDEVAQRILRESGQLLSLLALAVLRRLDMAGQAVQVAATGSVLEQDAVVRQAFAAALRAAAPQVQIIAPRHEPAIGAALLAQRAYASQRERQEGEDA